MAYLDGITVKFDIFREYEDKLSAIFTTRNGGVSDKPFDTLNLGLGTSDSEENVMRNMEIAKGELGLRDAQSRSVIALRQVHGRRILLADGTPDGEDDPGNGMYRIVGDTDGIIVASNETIGFTYYADCTPVFAYDKRQGIAAIAHSGWKGTALRIGAQLIDDMSSKCGSRIEDILFAIGPTADSCCYEVGEDVRLEFEMAGFKTDEFLSGKDDGKYMLSMKKANRRVLLDAGVCDEMIETADMCTICSEELFFSHRRDGTRAGRMSGIIALK